MASHFWESQGKFACLGLASLFPTRHPWTLTESDREGPPEPVGTTAAREPVDGAQKASRWRSGPGSCSVHRGLEHWKPHRGGMDLRQLLWPEQNQCLHHRSGFDDTELHRIFDKNDPTATTEIPPETLPTQLVSPRAICP